MEQRNGPLLAWFGDPDLKTEVVARMKAHRAQDEIVQGTYQQHSETEGGYKGCAVGCTLPNLFTYEHRKVDLFDGGEMEGHFRMDFIDPDDAEVYQEDGFHGLVQKYYGIDLGVAQNIDETFESQLTFQDATDFAVAVVETIPVGADLTGVAGEHQAWYEEQEDLLQAQYHPFRINWPPWVHADFERRAAAHLLHLLATAPVPEPV